MLEIGVALVKFAEAVIRCAEIVIGVGAVRIAGKRLLEIHQRRLVIPLLVKPNAFDVLTVSYQTAADGRHKR